MASRRFRPDLARARAAGVVGRIGPRSSRTLMDRHLPAGLAG
ncbi:hypothetical protein [Streptomyces lavendulocolor]